MFNCLLKGTLFAAVTLMILSAAQASHKSVTLGAVLLGGGCKNAPVSTRISRSTGHFIVAPENYVAVIEGSSSIARKTCLFSIPFEGKPNRAVRLRLPKVIGALALDEGSTANINYEIFFSGLVGEKTILPYIGNENILEDEFDETSSAQEVVYECGKSGIIRGNSSILVRNSNPNSRVALAQIKKLGVKIDSVPCQ